MISVALSTRIERCFRKGTMQSATYSEEELAEGRFQSGNSSSLYPICYLIHWLIRYLPLYLVSFFWIQFREHSE